MAKGSCPNGKTMLMPRSSRLDELRSGLDETLGAAKQAAYNTKKAYDQSTVGRWHNETTRYLTFFGHLWALFLWVWGRLPFRWVWMNLVVPLARRYRDWIWFRLVYGKDKYGAKRFSIWRGFATIFGTLVFATILWAHIWFALVGVVWYLPLVQHNEVLYLYNSQKISEGLTDSTWDDIHEVHGCETLPCTDQTSVTFRVRASWFNEVWSIYHHGTLFYPGYVAGAVAPVMEKCTITSYGIRKKFRTLLRSWDVYPDLLQVKSCAPVDEKAPVLQNKDYR